MAGTIRPRAPMAHRGRTGGSPYRLVSIILLIAIIVVGWLLLSRLTATRGGSTPSPSPGQASVTWLIRG